MSNKELSVNVKFKPKGINVSESTSIKEVNINVSEYLTRKEYYEIAKDKCIKNDVIDKFGMKYWEPYDVMIYGSKISEYERKKPIETI